ncbi:MAG: molybdenum ABC transporter permease subunit [Pirellulaceae bacterium]|nr:MAG: molybdenum ABC transporter permease subunit [Pirellulaceae bacterium]
MDWQAVMVSLQLASCTTLLLCLLGIPLAYWLAMSRWPGRFVIQAVVALPLVLPPTVLGFYLLLLLGPRGPVGGLFEAWTGRSLAFSFPGLVVASMLFSLPFAVRPFVVGFASIDRRLLEASWVLGESHWGTFWRVAVPLGWPGIVAGAVLAFAHTLGEFGVVLMVGGNIPGVTRTVSIAIYDEVQAMQYDRAAWASGLLLLVSFLAMASTYLVERRTWAI